MAEHKISGVIEVGSGRKDAAPAPAPGQAQAPQAKGNDPVRFMFKSERYFDHRGGSIEHRILISGAYPPGFPPYWGHAMVRIETPEGAMNEPMQFPIEGATTVEEAFSRFEACLLDAAERKKQALLKRYHQPQIAIPGQNMPANVPLPPPPQAKRGLIIPP